MKNESNIYRLVHLSILYFCVVFQPQSWTHFWYWFVDLPYPIESADFLVNYESQIAPFCNISSQVLIASINSLYSVFYSLGGWHFFTRNTKQRFQLDLIFMNFDVPSYVGLLYFLINYHVEWISIFSFMPSNVSAFILIQAGHLF